MEKIVYRVSLDVSKNGIQKTIQGIETGDRVAREIRITLRNGKENYELPLNDSLVAYMKVTKPSGEGADAQRCIIDENGEIVYTIQQSDVAQMGTCIYQLELLGQIISKDLVGRVVTESAVIISPRFAVEVWESEFVNSAYVSTYSWSALQNALSEARAYYQHAFDHFEVDVDTFRVSIVFKNGTVYQNDNLNIITDTLRREIAKIDNKLDKYNPEAYGQAKINGTLEVTGQTKTPYLVTTAVNATAAISTPWISNPVDENEIKVNSPLDLMKGASYYTSDGEKKTLAELESEKVNKENPETSGTGRHEGDFEFVAGDISIEGEVEMHDATITRAKIGSILPIGDNNVELNGTLKVEKTVEAQTIRSNDTSIKVESRIVAIDGITLDDKDLSERLQEIENKPNSSLLLESTSPLTASTNNNIVGLYAEGKSEQYISKNLFHAQSRTENGITVTEQADGGYKVVGTATNNAFFNTMQDLADGAYVMKLKFVGTISGANIYARVRDSANSIIFDEALSTATEKVARNTISGGVKTEITVGNGAMLNGTFYVQLEKGTVEPTKYEPYTGTPSPTNPVPIVDASGEVRAHTKNLFVPYIGTMVGLEFTKQNDGGIHIKGTSTQTAFARMSALIPNDTYALSYKISGSRSGNMYLRVRDANGTIIPYASLTISASATEASTSREMNGGAFTEITVESGTYDCVIYPMLEEGTIASEYVPYQSNSIDLADIGITLRSVNDIKNSLVVNEGGSGEWVQRVGMRDLAKLNWTFGWNTAWYTDNITDGVAPSIESIANIMSDSYVAKSMSPSPSASKVGEMGYWASSETKRLACNNGSSTTKPSGILYYELATPIVHTLTKEQVDAIRQLKTYEGTTLIATELQNVKVKYQGDIKEYIDSKFDTLYALIRQYHPEESIALMSLDGEVVADE